MRFPDKETVEMIRKEYPVGTRIELLKMDDIQAPTVGTKGTVRCRKYGCCVGQWLRS